MQIKERDDRFLLTGDERHACCRLCRVDGRLETSWPVRLALAGGVVSIAQNGRVAFEAVAAAPLPGAERSAGEFRFTFVAATGEEIERTARIVLHGTVDPARRGWDPDWDSGFDAATRTDGQIFVIDPERGKDSNAGERPDRPLATLQAAIDRIDPRGGDTILLRGGLHDGAADFTRLSDATRPTVVTRYRAERAVVSGARPIRGWRRCDKSRAALLGPGYEQVFERQLTGIAPDLETLEGLGLREGDRPLTLATDMAEGADPFLFGTTETFHRAESFSIRDDKIVAIRDPKVLGRYTPAQLAQMIGVVWSAGNRLSRFGVAAVDPDADNAVLLDPAPDAFPPDKTRFWRYALRNALAVMAPGQWGFAIEGDTLTLFLRPFEETSLESGIAYAAPGAGWDVGAASGLHIRGIAFEDFGGAGRHEGMALGNIAGAARRRTNRGIAIHNCRFARLHNPTANYGAIYFRDVAGLSITNCTFRDCQNAGMLLAVMSDLIVAGCLFERLTYAAMRVYDTHGAIVAFTDMHEVARTAHANVATFYGTKKGQGIDRLLLYGLRVSGANGYLTWQGASRVDMGFCDIAPPVLREDMRAVVDQNTTRSIAPPVPGETCLIWNNLFRHAPDRLESSGGALSLGKEGIDVRYLLANNVIGGGGVAVPYLAEGSGSDHLEVGRTANVYTKLAYWQSPRTGWKRQNGESVLSRLLTVFGNADGSGFRLTPGSSLVTAQGVDLQGVLEEGPAQRHPGFDFGIDIDGRPIDWSSVRLGPFQESWNLQIR